MGFPGGSMVRNLSATAGDAGSIPGSQRSPGGRSPGERNGSSLQYSCPGNPTDRRAWRAAIHGVTKESDKHSNKQVHTRGNGSEVHAGK